MNINCKTEKDVIDTKNALFIIPIEFEDKLNKSPEFNNSLHFSQTEVNMYNNNLRYDALNYHNFFH